LRKTWQAPREERPSADQERRVGQLEAMLERARGRVVRATELLVDGTIERGAYDGLMRKARAEIAAAEAKLGSVSPGGPPAQPSLPPLADVLAAVGEWATSLGGTDVGAQRAVLTVLAWRGSLSTMLWVEFIEWRTRLQAHFAQPQPSSSGPGPSPPLGPIRPETARQ
jgi:hypothetical protein